MEDCLTNVIKLSRTTCECYDTDKPEDYNEGKADIYLDELEGFDLKTLTGAESCASGIWDMLVWSREEAEKQLKADLTSMINQNYVSKRPAFSGLIGQTKLTASLNLTTATAGLKLAPPQINGGSITIKRIGIALNTSGPVDVSIYDNDEHYDTPLASFTINSVANTLEFATLADPLSLPLYSKNVDKIEYYIVYDRASSQPKDIKIDCNCGSKKPGWFSWMRAYGIRGTGSEYEKYQSDGTYSYGVVLDADLRCLSGIICSDDFPLDFENDGWAMQYAYAERWKAGALLVQKILDSSNLNRYTLLDREKLYGVRNHARKMYSEFVSWLAENRIVSSDCLQCKPNATFSTGSILS